MRAAAVARAVHSLAESNVRAPPYVPARRMRAAPRARRRAYDPEGTPGGTVSDGSLGPADAPADTMIVPIMLGWTVHANW